MEIRCRAIISPTKAVSGALWLQPSVGCHKQIYGTKTIGENVFHCIPLGDMKSEKNTPSASR